MVSVGNSLEQSQKNASMDNGIAVHVQSFMGLLRYVTVLPNFVVERWSRKIRRIDVKNPDNGLGILDELFVDYWSAFGNYKPGHEIFNLSGSKPLNFDSEMTSIKIELHRIESALLKIGSSSSGKLN